MEVPREALVISVVPITAWAIHRILEQAPKKFRCRIAPHPGAALPAGYRPEVLVVVPRNWREMARWVPVLRATFGGTPCLLYAEPCLAGMYAEAPGWAPSTIVESAAPPKALRAAVVSLARGVSKCPPAALLDDFARRLARVEKEGEPPLIPREIQCGCAVSLGLTNAQIAQTLGRTQGTVKNNIHRALRRLGQTEREELGAIFEQALPPPPVAD